MSKNTFNLGDYLKDSAVSKTDTAKEQIEYIPLEDIDPDPDNFYSLEGLDELAANIELVGLQQPLRVRPTPSVGSADSSPSGGAKSGRFTVVSGHRRRAACLLIRDGGSKMFEHGVPCIVERGDTSKEMQELRLIYANSSTRVMTSAELSKQAARVEELLYKLKEQGVEFPGRMRDHVAAAVNASKTKLARLHAIRGNLDSDLLPYFDDGSLTEDAAYTLSRFPPNLQEAIAREISGGKRKKMPTGSVVRAVYEHLDDLLKPFPCSAHAGAPECHHAEGRVLCSVFKQYSWDICPVGSCCRDCYKGKQGCSGACREAKDAFKLDKNVEAEKLAERQAAEEQRRDRIRIRVEKRCRELLPMIDAAGLKDDTPLYGYIQSAKAGDVRKWATEGAADKCFYSDECVYPASVSALTEMAKKLKVPASVLLGEKPQAGSGSKELTDYGSYLIVKAENLEESDKTIEELFTETEGHPRIIPASDDRMDVSPTWKTGTPPQAGRYFARIDMGDGGIHEAVGAYRGGSWTVFNGPLYETMKVIGWWPLPEKEVTT